MFNINALSITAGYRRTDPSHRKMDDPAVLARGPTIPTIPAICNLTASGSLVSVTTNSDIEMAAHTTPGNSPFENTGYKQCTAARQSTNNVELVQVWLGGPGANPTTNVTGKKLTGIGSLDREEDYAVLRKIFRGSRMCKSGQIVNESISSTVDPLNLSCLKCAKEHSLITGDKPMILFLTDQNMVPNAGNCSITPTVVIRSENSSLSELADLCCEIFDGREALNPGSVLLIGSLSELHKGGAAAYIEEWVKIQSRLANKFAATHICPMVPVYRDNIPGELVQELVILGAWVSKAYTGNPAGILEIWAALITATTARMSGYLTLPVPIKITVKLPATLGYPIKSAVTIKFEFDCSSPDQVLGLDREALHELFATVDTVLGRDFGLGLGMDGKPGHCTADSDCSEKIDRIVLVGASNLGRVADMLGESGFTVLNLCKPGWRGTPEEVSATEKTMQESGLKSGDVIIMDLYGNLSYRTIEFDGSSSIIKKGPSGYHVTGKIGTADDHTLRRITAMLEPLFKCCGEIPTVIVPPLPRYVFNPCCNNDTHCTNITESGYPEKALAKVDHMRSLIRGEINRKGTGNLCVANSLELISGQIGKGDGVSLKVFLGKDGVHLNQAGYRNVCKGLAKLAQGIVKKEATASCSKKGAYWRGFLSPTGSLERSARREGPPNSGGRGGGTGGTGPYRGRRHHPYKQRN